MDDLIKALQIISKGIPKDEGWPTNCSHDMLWVKGDWSKYTDEEIQELDDLGFIKDEESESGFISFKYGSC